MYLRDLKIGWRLLVKEMGFSIVVIFSLSLGFAACFLLLGYARYCMSYDSAVQQADRIFLVEHKDNLSNDSGWHETTFLPFVEAVQHSGLAESVTSVRFSRTPFKVGIQVYPIELLTVQSTFQEIFDPIVIAGDLRRVLSKPDELALTVSAVRNMFGDIQALGKIVQINGNSYVVGAILADPASNSTVNYAALAGFSNNATWNEESRQHYLNSWADGGGAKVFVKLKSGVSATTLQQTLQKMADQSPFSVKLDPDIKRQFAGKTPHDIRVVNLGDLYFDRASADTWGSGRHGDSRAVWGMAAIGLLILLLATTNYVNLATLRTVSRQREIALRKILGASVGRIISLFLAESIVVAIIAAGMGLLIAWLLLPIFSDLVNRQLGGVFSLMSILCAFLFAIFVGLLAGCYPAWIALRVRPPQTISGRGSSETVAGLWLRRGLTLIQFSAAMTLSSLTIAIAWQSYFASHTYPGFDPANLLVVELPHGLKNPATRGFKEEMLRTPNVVGVAGSHAAVGQNFYGENGILVRNETYRTSVLWRSSTSNFLEVLGVQPIAGRIFTSKLDRDDESYDEQVAANDAYTVLNMAAVKALGYATPDAAIGQILKDGVGKGKIMFIRVIGVIPDIHDEDLHELPQPTSYYGYADQPVLTIRTTGDLNALEKTASELAQKYFPNDIVTIRREQSYFDESYADDVRLAKTLGFASFIAITIASFGIYVLAAYNTQRRRREIVLRKLYGATKGKIAQLLANEFFGLIVLAGMIGLPIAGIVTARYLSSFVEQAPIGAWPLITAFAVTLLIAIGATLRHTLMALRLAPAEAFGSGD